jgi:DNA (cytosine-5)-methyltransferase 1
MKIGLRVNKGDKEYVSADEAVLEIGIGGGQIASALTCVQPNFSIHHSNYVLEGGEMKKEIIPCKLDKMPEGKLIHDIKEAKVCDLGTETDSTDCARYYKGLSAHKDNMILEHTEGEEMKIKNSTKQGFLECPVGGCFDGQFPNADDRRGRVQDGGNVTPTLTAEASTQIYYNVDDWRIRKLTPKECYRLMGYHDKAYNKASEVNSGTQLYKQAGNAIVKQVLMAIFLQMGIQNKKKWNDMSAEEKQEMIKKSII